MRIVGIDPGSRRENPTGVALLEVGVSIDVLEVFSLKPDAKGGDWGARVADIAGGIDAYLEKSAVLDAVAIEAPVLARHHRKVLGGVDVVQINPESLGPLWALFGAVWFICSRRDIPVVRVQPQEAKNALTGQSNADKDMMVKAAEMLTDRELVSHEADAIGIGLAGATKWRQAELGVMVKAPVRVARARRRAA